MKTSDSDLKANRNIYPDAVNVIGCVLIGPKCDQLGPINISGYIFRLTFRSLSDVFTHSDECRTKKAFKYVKRMLPLFRAVKN